MTRTLTDDLMDLASAQAMDLYGCNLDRLDPEILEWYTEQVTEANLEEFASDLAHAAWQAY